MRGVRPWLAFAITAALLGAAASWRNGKISRNTTTTKTTAKLVLLSAPRSGSTLLVEMLRAPASDACPFHASDLRASAKDGFAGNAAFAAYARRAASLDADDRPALLELCEADLRAGAARRARQVERFLGVPGGRFRHDAPPVKQHAAWPSPCPLGRRRQLDRGRAYATATSCSSKRRLADDTADAAAARKKHQGPGPPQEAGRAGSRGGRVLLSRPAGPALRGARERGVVVVVGVVLVREHGQQRRLDELRGAEHGARAGAAGVENASTTRDGRRVRVAGRGIFSRMISTRRRS
ncbi:hypothetical protein JL721_13016 [Aureococcus anophagefferens]|nr:hypothetical protein JL721_13016 [Aureococcus anophagefferens]